MTLNGGLQKRNPPREIVFVVRSVVAISLGKGERSMDGQALDRTLADIHGEEHERGIFFGDLDSIRVCYDGSSSDRSIRW